MATAEALLTAEDYASLPDNGRPTELVKGRVVVMTPPAQPHGLVCSTIAFILQQYLVAHDVGRVATNDSGVITERNPDSVRGPDVSFYRHDQIPPKPFAPGYWNAVPPLVCEVLSPSDVWVDILDKVAEYLRAGVRTACVFDPKREAVHVFHVDREPGELSGDDELTLPGILDEFRAPVRRFFA